MSTATSRLRGIDPAVFLPALAIAGGFILWGAAAPESLASATNATLGAIINGLGWSFVVSTAVFLAFSLFLAISRFGKVRLGLDGERPEFKTISWVCMMFSVGMGIGLMFWGVAEPLYHFAGPPHAMAAAQTKEAALVAMQYSYFHWALHPWAIYAVVGLSIAYFTYRKGLPILISSAFTPLLGDKVHGPIGKTIDILAVIATLFGTATSLGLGAQQINSGLNYLWATGENNGIALTVIAVLTIVFILSAVSGSARGFSSSAT